MGCSPNICFKNNRLYLCPRRPCSLKWWHTTGQKCPVVCRTMLGCVQVGSVVWRVTRELVKTIIRHKRVQGPKVLKRFVNFRPTVSRGWLSLSFHIPNFVSVGRIFHYSCRSFCREACPTMSVARSGVLSTKPVLAAEYRCCGRDPGQRRVGWLNRDLSY